MFIQEIKKSLQKVLPEVEISVEHPSDFAFGDYSTNIALILAKKEGKKPQEFAVELIKKWQTSGFPDFVEKVDVAGIGFINIWLKIETLSKVIEQLLGESDSFGRNNSLKGKKIMVEYGHPNTHKELHIGHMRTLITGEAISRIIGACGAKVFRANYQGDIGPHVAKAIWGTQKIIDERKISWEEAEKLTLAERAHLLGEGYIKGSQEYEQVEKEIDQINVQIYSRDPQIMPVYERTRRWSLEYYESFYLRFLTRYDRLFFESEVAEKGKEIVKQNIGKIFEESQGAVIFDGEKYGLHKRVFITANGTPTYEAKEMALAQEQYRTFAFDQNIHVVGNEQSGYFKVVIKALELLYPQLKGKEYHLPMGMVNLIGRKMSSRTGEIMRVDDLLLEIKSLLQPLIKESKKESEREEICEKATIGAIKYSVLRVGPETGVIFDPKQSVSLQGDSGPYLQYTYARTQSVLQKLKDSKIELVLGNKPLNDEEISLLRTIYRFPEILEEAGKQLSPNILCNFLFNLAQKFNLFYDKQRIIGDENQDFRLALTVAVGQLLKNGLVLLGIEALKKM